MVLSSKGKVGGWSQSTGVQEQVVGLHTHKWGHRLMRTRKEEHRVVHERVVGKEGLLLLLLLLLHTLASTTWPL